MLPAQAIEQSCKVKAFKFEIVVIKTRDVKITYSTPHHRQCCLKRKKNGSYKLPQINL